MNTCQFCNKPCGDDNYCNSLCQAAHQDFLQLWQDEDYDPDPQMDEQPVD